MRHRILGKVQQSERVYGTGVLLVEQKPVIVAAGETDRERERGEGEERERERGEREINGLSK